MLKRTASLFLFLAPLLGRTQITLSAQLPPSGLVQKEQLWNLVLVNNTGGDVDALLVLNVQDAASGQSVLSASTGTFLLTKGMKTVSSRTVEPVQYTATGPGLTSNFLPLGSYTACYTVYKRRADYTEKLAEECVRLNITPLSPPMLITPTDKAVLPTAYPQLSWTGPAPLDMFTDLNYEVKVAEVLAGQSSSQALLYNAPVYVKTNTKATFEAYPSTYSKLETGKTYAWQVTARNGMAYSTPTDVWTFSIAGDSAVTARGAVNYTALTSNKSEAGHSYVSDSLYVRYYSFDKEHEAVIRFRSVDGKLMEEKKQTIHYGDNFLRYRIGRRYQPGNVYVIEIADLQNTPFLSFFSVKQSN